MKGLKYGNNIILKSKLLFKKKQKNKKTRK